MKSSGIEWIGDIPEDWEVKKLKYVAELDPTISKFLGDNDIVSFAPMECLGEQTLSPYETEYGKVKGKYTYFANEDIIMAKVTPCFENGNIAIAKNLKNNVAFGSSELFVFRAKNISNSFLMYSLYSEPFKSLAKSTMYGTGGLKRVSPEFILNYKIPFPPLKTQEKIADYLDEKCGEIDATITKQKESIEKLKAYKQSLISETVTKGLDKSAPLKPSGIEWIGDIPAHWEVKRIKELFSFGKGLPISKEDLIENGVPVINYGQIHSKDNNGTSIKDSLIRYVDLNYKNTNMTSLVESGDFIFADTSEDLDGCGNCIYVDSKYPIFAGYHCIILRSIKRNSSKYLAYLFHMDAWRTQIRRNVTGVKVFSISKKILGKSYLIFPPRYEQECIVDYLHEKCNEIDAIINKKQNIIQKLDAYKKSLIFECITGKQIT